MNLSQLRQRSAPQLMELLLAGHSIEPTALDDTEYHGVSLGLPHALERLTWTTFVKAFHRDPQDGSLRGWNVRIDQDEPFAYRPRRRRGKPHTFGHFAVVSAAGRRMPQPCHHGLLLDYGRGARTRLAATAALRDPVVALDPDSAERLLGWTYLEVAGRQVSTPSFFYLERAGALSHRA